LFKFCLFLKIADRDAMMADSKMRARARASALSTAHV
jgi:hypothetical protein